MLDTLYYTEHLPKTSTAGQQAPPVVVLLHGLFGSSDNLNVIGKHLAQNYRVINIDLPDHGKSPRSAIFSFDDYAKKVIATLGTLNINRASIVGHSLGGKVAMWIAYLQAQLIEKLIILDIAPVAYEPRHQSVLQGLAAVQLNSISSRKDAESQMSHFIEDAGTQAFLLKSLYEEDGRWRWRFNVELLTRDYKLLSAWPLLNKLVYAKETLFIKGEESDYILAEHQAIILKQFPKAKAKLVKAGHWLHAQKPQIVNSLITKHLQG
jgi:esterase